MRGCYLGLEDVQYISHGQSDAELIYKGVSIPEPDIGDCLWNRYSEECKENGIKATFGGFEDWAIKNRESAYEYLENSYKSKIAEWIKSLKLSRAEYDKLIKDGYKINDDNTVEFDGIGLLCCLKCGKVTQVYDRDCCEDAYIYQLPLILPGDKDSLMQYAKTHKAVASENRKAEKKGNKYKIVRPKINFNILRRK